MASARFSFLRSIGCLLLGLTAAAVMHGQTYGDGFDPNSDSNIYAMVRQPDGKIIVGGAFTLFEPDRFGVTQARQRIARINRDGSLDSTFATVTDGDISAMALQPDGRILIAGKFTWVESATGANPGRFARNGMARLLPDGSVDESFVQINPVGVGEPPYQHFPQAIIRTIALQPDGRIVIGGAFISLQPVGSPAPIARSRIARLNADGRVDTSFDVAANNTVLALLVEPNGDIVIGGGFTTIRGTGGTATARTRIARVTSTGALADGFTAVLDNRVLALARQADGKILVGGEFTRVTVGGTGRDAGSLMRFQADGTVDTTFTPFANAAVETIAIQADGRLVVGGRFQWIRKNAASVSAGFGYIARMFVDGTIDSSFFPNASAPVTSVVLQPDGTLVVAGYFTSIGTGSGSAAPRGRLARLQADGTLDVAFRVSGAGAVIAVEKEVHKQNANDPDTYLVAGNFSSLGGVSRFSIARISATGQVTPFGPSFNGPIVAVRPLADGNILVGGNFTRVNDQNSFYLARISKDGVLDTSFKPTPNAGVFTIVSQGDKILVGGNFTNFQPDATKDAVIRRYVARLNANGTVDTTFDPSPNLSVNNIAVTSDGKVLIAGDFTSLQPNGANRATAYFYIARINADGTPDDTFQPRPNQPVATMKLQADGKIMIGGSFTTFLPNKETTTTTRYYVARLNTDGSIDTSFEAKPNNSVFNVERFSDGRYAIHGVFTLINHDDKWVEHPYLAWLTPTGALDTSRDLKPDTVPAMTKVIPGATAADDALFVGGTFTRFTGNEQVTIVQDQLVRILPSGALDPAFALRPESTGGAYVSAFAPQVGGRVYAAGSFTNFGGSANSNVVRVFPDGTNDSTFNTKSNGAIHALLSLEASVDEEQAGGPLAWIKADGEYRSDFSRAGAATFSGNIYAIGVQGDGKVVVGGEFGDGVGASVGNLARLNADGSVDTNFSPEPNGAVQTLAILGNGSIIIGGSFTAFGTTNHARLARISPTGVLDTTWAPTPNGTVLHVVPLSDGSVLVGGVFTSFSPNGATTAVNRPYVARIKTDGTVDTDFNAEANGAVNRIAVQQDGKIVLGGSFTTIKDRAREYLARVDNRGVLDTAFYPKPNAPIERLALIGTSGMVVSGRFTSFKPNDADPTVSRSLVARLNTDGTVEPNFKPTPNNVIQEIGIRADGSIVLVGSFTAFQMEQGATAIRRNYMARFNADGTIDTLFNPNANSTVYTLNLRPAGQPGDPLSNSMLIGGAFSQLRPSAILLVGGAFTEISESPTPHLARLNQDGTVDALYAPRPDGAVHALAEQSNGMVLVAGAFKNIATVARAHLARLEAGGSLDLNFDPVIDQPVEVMAVQADDRVLIAGNFTTIDGASRTRLARLLADGALDSGFNPSVDTAPEAIAVQRDGAVLIAGTFTQVNGTSRPHLARLNPDGTLDSGFAPAINGAVHAVAPQADGRIVIGGAFTEVGGQPRTRLARLMPDGSLDASAFDVAIDGAVHGLLVLADGRVVVGGAFTQFAGRRQLLLGRLGNPTPAAQSATLSSDFSTFTWMTNGSSPLFSSVEVATSADGQIWVNAGNAVLDGSGAWSRPGLTGFKADAFNHIRLRAVHPSAGSGSAGRYETTWAFYGSQKLGPATSLNQGGALAGWLPSYWTDPTTGSGGSGGGGSGGGSGGGGSGGSGGGSGDGSGGSGSQQSFHLVNLSVRAWPDDGQPFIAGLVLSGQSEGRLLLRGVGPSLVELGLDPEGLMTAPRMSLFDGEGRMLSSASSWDDDTVAADTAEVVGAFPLAPGSDDVAVVRTLQPGAYTLHIDAGQGLNGIALGEVYFASETGGLANFSARAQAGAGTAACIAGFVVGGDQPRRFLIRGVGPSLVPLGVADAVQDTKVHLFDADGRLIGTNDDWGQQTGATPVSIASAAAHVGAFALPDHSKDAALVVELAPGAYTVHVGGGVAGTVLAEIYEIP